MREYQTSTVNTIQFESLTLRLQSTATTKILPSVECSQNVDCPGNSFGGFTGGTCFDHIANGSFFLPGSKESDPPHCTIIVNKVSGECSVSIDRDNTCSDGAFWFISCQGNYVCPEETAITIHCDGYIDDHCQI